MAGIAMNSACLDEVFNAGSTKPSQTEVPWIAQYGNAGRVYPSLVSISGIVTRRGDGRQQLRVPGATG